MITKRIRIYGIVQGVGFRPTVSRHAMACQITGTVSNKGPYVEVYAQGRPSQVERMIEKIKKEPPKRAVLLKVDTETVESKPFETFSIIESKRTRGEIFISPDIAICEDCKKELYDANDRRYLHPFINCTCCGPRLTILESLPYDRVRTSMKEFPMCPDCAQEYYDPATRRYDAQPVCCNECGPHVFLMDKDLRDGQAITYCRKAILDGKVIAIKGIGGFHLCCDATNEKAVDRLRRMKHRPAKPFAVMMRNLEVVQKECILTQPQQEILTGHQKPILLLQKKQHSHLCDAVAPDNPKVGVMLPYAPVQMLLFDYPDGLKMPDSLIMTSGNVSGAPICRQDQDVREQILHFCDDVLTNDRKIRIRCDDTVMDFYDDQPYMIRRSRGYAPLPVLLSNGYRGQVAAIGGELKNTFCIGVNDLYYPSPYIGDLEDIRTVEALKETLQRMEEFLEVKPQVVACDLHPKYQSRAVAESLGLPVVYVQHHYAHILSCMAENDWSQPVIGVSFDGTGYGTDGTIWGGEFLLCDPNGFERAGSIVPFQQVGGDIAAKEGWRIAVSMIWDLYPENALDIIEALQLCDARQAKLIGRMAKNGLNTIVSTSAGRLFDAVSAILSIRKSSTFESEASVTLQFEAEKNHEALDVPDLSVIEDSIKRIDTASLVRWIIEKKLEGKNVQALAYHFHSILAHQIVQMCRQLQKETKRTTVALSGGVYQNTLLLDLTKKELEHYGFHVLCHRMIPPNDGGIGLGQAYYAMHMLNRKEG